MKNLIKNRKPFSKSIFFAMVFIVQLSTSVFAHDLGISSLNLYFSNNELKVFSSYAKGDIEEFIQPKDFEQIKALADDAILIEIDGKIIKAKSQRVLPDNADGLNFEHNFGEISGSKIEIISKLPSSLSPNHTQILTVVRGEDKEIARQLLKNGNYKFEFDLEKVTTPSGFGQFLTLGIEHIVFGFDHLLFLFALLLTVRGFREIVGIVTFFTVAHSITLSLVSLNVFSVPNYLVEPIIALSIVYVGIENFFKKEHKNRWLIAYAFGLVHGLGFASVLQEIGIGEGINAVLPLLSFNLGVEIGQIAVVLLVLPLLWKLQEKSFYTSRFVPVGSALIIIAGTYWLIERTLF